MTQFRFSLAGLMGAMFVVAIALAAMVSTSDVWSTSLFSAAAFALFVAILGIIYCRERLRAFWVGFAVLGWGYMLLGYGPWFQNHVSPSLLTSALASSLYPKLLRTQPQPQTTMNPVASAQPSPPTGNMGGIGAPGGGPSGSVGGPGTAMAAMGGSLPGNRSSSAPGPRLIGPSQPSLWRTCHSLLTLLLAWAGGQSARYFYEKRGNKTEPPSAPEPRVVV